MKAEEIMASVSLTLGVPVAKIAEAIQIAVDIHSDKAGVCSVCGKPITYQSEYEYCYWRVSTGQPGYEGFLKSEWKAEARSEAQKFRAKKVRCSRCRDLVCDASYYGRGAEQFFNTLAVAGAVAACTSNVRVLAEARFGADSQEPLVRHHVIFFHPGVLRGP